jgi:ABC-type transport system substrate-binding protein
MRIRRVLAFAFALAAVGLSACGSSSKTSSAGTVPAQAATRPTISIASPSTATAIDPAFVAGDDAVRKSEPSSPRWSWRRLEGEGAGAAVDAHLGDPAGCDLDPGRNPASLEQRA